MIPKVIHYCWFGGKPLPDSALKCIASWKKFFPGYEIKEWNESNYDISSAPLYVRQAYEAKKWAFVSDYARFDILYKNGGLYFDTDVEVIMSFEDIVSSGPFMGCENDASVIKQISVAPGLCIGAEPEMPVIKEILNFYNSIFFFNDDGTLNTVTIVQYTTDILKNHGLQNIREIQSVAGFKIYPAEYFCPVNEFGIKKNYTLNTHSIHWYSASWFTEESKIGREKTKKKARIDNLVHLPNRVIRKLLGSKNYDKLKSKFK